MAAKQGGRSLVLYAMPLLAGLSITHAFLPPHPGPVAAAGLLHVEREVEARRHARRLGLPRRYVR